MRFLLYSLASLIFCASGLLLNGCSDDNPTAPEPLHVLTTVYAMADIVKHVGGERVAVEWLVESGQSLDQLKETPERRQQFRNADLVVTRGAADPWTLEGSGNTYRDRRLLRVDDLSAARNDDPRHYMWLDPQVALELADELVVRLATIEPRSESYFKANAAVFREHVAGMMDQTSSTVNRAGGGVFPTLDPGFLPLARRFGLAEVRVPQISLNEPTQTNVKALSKSLRDSRAGGIYANSETPLALLRDWETRLTYPVLPLDSLGTSTPTGRSDYLAMLQYNLSQLERGISLAGPRDASAPVPLGAVQTGTSDTAPPATTGPTPTLATPPEPQLPVNDRSRLRVPTTAPALPPSPFQGIPFK